MNFLVLCSNVKIYPMYFVRPKRGVYTPETLAQIDGYDSFHAFREFRTGGGVGIFTKNKFKAVSPVSYTHLTLPTILRV